MNADNAIEVLLVEDNPSDLRLVLRVLKEQNFGDHVHLARDGEEALDFMFSRGPFAAYPLKVLPKVILLDLKLPLVDGIEVLREIRANPRTKHMPVVALTSSSNEKDIAECYALGVNSYIQKPLEFGRFKQTLQAIAVYWLTMNCPPLPQQSDNT